ncbi:MAG: TPM domain-containing protein [Alistipes sp.]|nr:TPM domain-containing protein [Alistipes sp.]
MKRLFIIILLLVAISPIHAREYRVKDVPNVQLENRYRFTSNPDGILEDWAVAQIDSICYDLRHRGIAQTAVVALREIDTDDVFEFAYELFSSWGVGSKSNSGIGVILVEEAREIRFVTGYGVEGVLPDAICKRIQNQYMLPYFRDGDYSRGMVAGLQAIRAVLNGSELDAGGNDDYVDEDEEALVAMVVFFIIVIIGSMIVVVIADRKSRTCPTCKQLSLQKDSTRLLSRNFGASTYEDTFICTKCGTVVKRKRQDYNSSHNNRGGGPIIMGGMGRGFGGGSSFGGGWGGGSFGGGGAGSRW